MKPTPGNAIRSARAAPLPAALREACRRAGVPPTRHLLLVSVEAQRACWIERLPAARRTSSAWSSSARHGVDVGARIRWPVSNPPGGGALYAQRAVMRCSTSRFGVGQEQGSFRTPLGLHRIAAKIGGGWPVGTIFEGRRPAGYTWQGRPAAGIVHRIFWLEGLEEGFNRGGRVDSRARYIYVHGFGDETTLGRPVSCGCIHLAADDLLPLFDRLPVGTLVWIAPRW